mmetsp:Transcript_13711/g.38985  ORF Transcript_13711/g.38985 Transcript_13711/m.38985 type:complete len:221 (+) Transcript_13711:1337-1999(+)
MFATITVRQLPPRESLRRRVSFESRYGTNELPDASALMQFPRASSDRLMFAPSMRRTPRLSVCDARSDPARSIIDSFPMNVSRCSRCSTVTCSTACDLDEVTFIAVGSVLLRWLPECSNSITSSADSASVSVTPATHMPLTGSSRRSRQPPRPSGVSRSHRFSLYTSMKEHLTATVLPPSPAAVRASTALVKSVLTVRSITPGSSGVPIMVNVFPAPVAP